MIYFLVFMIKFDVCINKTENGPQFIYHWAIMNKDYFVAIDQK